MNAISQKKEVSDLAREKWKSSGISDASAAKLGLRLIQAGELTKLNVHFHRVQSLLIPYFDLDGERTKFYRIRYLETLPGFAGASKKPQRYTQAPGTLNEIYLPPTLSVPWREVAKDSKIPIYITEGELKAAAAAEVGLACIGLGGVDVWRSSKRGIEFLPTLREINWKNRQVVIVYDSDAAQKPDVMRAERQLAAKLTAQGAMPAIAALPPGPAGAKQGLDDFLVASGHEALFKIIEDSSPFPEAEALWQMNERVVYVRKPGIIISRDTGQKMKSADFVQHAFANTHYMEQIVTKNSVKLVKKPLAPRWLQWENRFELSGITYQPGADRVHDDKWNLWPGWGVDPKLGDVSPWSWLLDYLFQNETAARHWFEQWCAYPLQYPGTKLFTSAVLWGRYQGTGKTLIAYTLRRIYGDNFREIKNRDLRGNFNDWAENKQFVYGDEITGGDKRVDADWLKGMITQEHISINAKFLPTFTLRDCINYYFSSNHPDAFFLEDTDRRYFVHEVEVEPAIDYSGYDAWLKGEGPSYLFDHLLRLDLTGFDPLGHALSTSSKARMLYDSKSDLGIWCQQLREDPATTLKILGEKIAKECDLYTPSQLLSCYDPDHKSIVSQNGLSRELKRSGFFQVNKGIPIKTDSGLIRLYNVRNSIAWKDATPAECREHYEKFFSTKPVKF